MTKALDCDCRVCHWIRIVNAAVTSNCPKCKNLKIDDKEAQVVTSVLDTRKELRSRVQDNKITQHGYIRKCNILNADHVPCIADVGSRL